MSELDCKSSPHLTPTVKDHWNRLPKGVRINYHSSVLWSTSVKNQFPLYIPPSSGLFFISPDEDLLFEVETSRVNFLVSFNSDDQRKTDVAITADVTTYKLKDVPNKIYKNFLQRTTLFWWLWFAILMDRHISNHIRVFLNALPIRQFGKLLYVMVWRLRSC